eukprot:122436_1
MRTYGITNPILKNSTLSASARSQIVATMVKRPTLKVDTTVGASRRVNSECKQDNDEKEEKHPNPSVTSTTSGLLSTPSEPGSPIPTSAQGDMTPLRRRIRKSGGGLPMKINADRSQTPPVVEEVSSPLPPGPVPTRVSAAIQRRDSGRLSGKSTKPKRSSKIKVLSKTAPGGAECSSA